MGDLFGYSPPPDQAGAMTDVERKRMRRRAYAIPRGHVMPSGTGPAGETCGSCRHLERVQPGVNIFRKCGLNRAAWTHGPKSDVRARDAACSKWEPATRPEED